MNRASPPTGPARPVPAPPHPLLAADGFRDDYADAFRMEGDGPLPSDADVFRGVLGAEMPALVRALFRLRDALVRPLGLRTTNAPGDGSERLGIFAVRGRTAGAVLVGVDDRHLDLRVLIRIERGEAAWAVTMATYVRFHGWLGRAYFGPVRPIHRILVPAMFRRDLRRLLASGAPPPARTGT